MGEGITNTVQVQDYAGGATQQGASGVEAMGALGNSGRNPSSMFRALKSLLGMPAGAPEFFWAEVPLKHGRKYHIHSSCLIIFSSFYHQCPDKFEKAISGPAGMALEFWRSMRTTEFVRNHPALPRGVWDQAIPIGMHGDGGAFSKTDSLYTISWNSLLGAGSTIQKRFLFTIVRKSEMVPETLDRIFHIMSWSFNALLAGKTPVKDHDGYNTIGGGEVLAHGLRGVLCQIRGDWQFYQEVFKFPAWNGALEMCWLCRASSTIPGLAFIDFGNTAGWRATPWSHEAYMEKKRGEGFVPVLLASVLGLRLECVMIDILHTVDLGIGAHIIGNILFIFAVVRGVFGGRTMKEKVAMLNARLKLWYSENKVTSRLRGDLTLDKLRTKKSWPKLKGKAAPARHCARFALSIVLAHMTTSDEDQRIAAVIQLLVRFYDLVMGESMFMRDHVIEEIKTLGARLAMLYSSLAKKAFEDNRKLWKVTPKLHLFVHLCEWQAVEFGNPRYYWTYPDEDLVGLLIDIAQSCHPRTMAVNSLFKWLRLAFDERYFVHRE